MCGLCIDCAISASAWLFSAFLKHQDETYKDGAESLVVLFFILTSNHFPLHPPHIPRSRHCRLILLVLPLVQPTLTHSLVISSATSFASIFPFKMFTNVSQDRRQRPKVCRVSLTRTQSKLFSVLAVLAAGAGVANAHGHVKTWVVGGENKPGYNPSNSNDYGGVTAQRPADNSDQGKSSSSCISHI